MNKKLWLSLALVFALFIPKVNAQHYFGVGVGYNYLSDGVNVTKVMRQNKRFSHELGLRYMVNTFSINKNKENFEYYQNGYSKKLWEHFGIVYRPKFKLWDFGNFSLSAASNIYITWHGIRTRTTDVYVWGMGLVDDVSYNKPALAAEITIGLNLGYKFKNGTSLHLYSGVGAIYLDHDYTVYSETRNVYDQIHLVGNPQFFEDRGRGAIELVGLEFPATQLTYVFPINFKKNKSEN